MSNCRFCLCVSTVIFPNLVTPININEGQSRVVSDLAMQERKTILGLALKDGTADPKSPDSYFRVGVEMAIGRSIAAPDGFHSALAQGRRRMEVIDFDDSGPILIARAIVREDTGVVDSQLEDLELTLSNMFQQAVSLNDNISDDILSYVSALGDPGWLADFVASTLTLSLAHRQEILEESVLHARLRLVIEALAREMRMLELKDEIKNQIQQEMSHAQREMYLREQVRIIQNELGEADIFQAEIQSLHQQIADAGLSPAALEKSRTGTGKAPDHAADGARIWDGAHLHRLVDCPAVVQRKRRQP